MARPQRRGRGSRAETVRSKVTKVEDPYEELLRDVKSSSPSHDEEHTVKKRRIGGRLVVQAAVATSEPASDDASRAESVASPDRLTIPPAVQTAYNDSGESEDSDVDWEDVKLEDAGAADLSAEESSNEAQPAELSLVLDKDKEEETPQRRTARRRKPVTAQARKLRLEIHKLNLLCLLSHVFRRNHWCNDEDAQGVLRKLLSKKTSSLLDDDESQLQFQRNRSFALGLQQAGDAFKAAYKIDARGMARSFWADDADYISESGIPEDIDLLMDKEDFRDAARKLRGSRDVGAQLFCTLLRSTGVDARLVCSLQALPITATAKGNTPSKQGPAMTIYHTESRTGMKSDSHKSRHASKKMKVRESPFPVYWVEAFNAAYQKWVPVDPLVTNTTAKPTKFEPPASDLQNNMSYVVVFEEDGAARDVTRRYAKAYNAKTRKSRVESTKDGEKWWKRVMRIYKRPYGLDRDQVEDAELTTKEAQEPMPANVQDFKDHPYYALERHVKRNEVIHPRREVGKVSTGKGGLAMDKAVESIYRRRDVHIVKSADSWYRLGREIKPGEQALKVVQPRVKKPQVLDDDESGDEENAGTPMYTGFQTCAYQAPPIVNGRVPRNQYGNLDVYVASMVPPGGAHIIHPDAARSARLLGIDYADAVTGFEFKGRNGTAIVKGAVVAAEYVQAVVEVIRGYNYQRYEAESLKKSMNALRMWRRFLAGLRIRERIQGYASEGEEQGLQDHLDDLDETEETDAGGFLPDREQEAVPEPTRHRTPEEPEPSIPIPLREALSSSEQDDLLDEPQVILGPILEAKRQPEDSGKTIPTDDLFAFDNAESVGGGGFMTDEIDDLGGGFMPEDEEKAQPVADGHISKLSQPSEEEMTELSLKDQSSREHSLEMGPLVAPARTGADPAAKDTLEEQDMTKATSSPPDASSDDAKDSGSSGKGSLLSQDPEDEDADPEWLA